MHLYLNYITLIVGGSFFNTPSLATKSAVFNDIQLEAKSLGLTIKHQQRKGYQVTTLPLCSGQLLFRDLARSVLLHCIQWFFEVIFSICGMPDTGYLTLIRLVITHPDGNFLPVPCFTQNLGTFESDCPEVTACPNSKMQGLI